MQMRHISALFMLSSSKDDLCYITDCDDVFKVKRKPEMLRLMNAIISDIGVSGHFPNKRKLSDYLSFSNMVSHIQINAWDVLLNDK